MHARDWFLVFIAIFLPPVAVGLKRGFFTKDTLINLLLFLLGFFPGLVHALYVISRHPYPAAGGSLAEPSTGYGSLA
ncbi:LAFE_0G00760g1_1 [Lachancea fermentati]|uniref:LAFE_0G00760g1_1 n=1 Tax=Lachancea fermentati TaxID=4955 RepID=A0A1G4MGP1_LACFM|nr:LAFE_0G00760g1_1 [Lachancea fermentati]